jgi:urease accessory protein
VIARAALVAEADGRGGTRMARLRSAAPLVLRTTAQGVYLVGGAAGPLGGDDLSLELHVGPGARLTVRTAAASVALAGRRGPSRLCVDASVAAGGTLCWLPEPAVAAGGCRHRTVVRLSLEEGAKLAWRDEVLLGRHHEAPGSWRVRTELDVDGRPVLRQELRVGDDGTAWGGSAVTGGARAVGSLLVADPAWAASPLAPVVLGPGAAILPLAGPAALVSAVAEGALALPALLEAGAGALHPSADSADAAGPVHR